MKNFSVKCQEHFKNQARESSKASNVAAFFNVIASGVEILILGIIVLSFVGLALRGQAHAASVSITDTRTSNIERQTSMLKDQLFSQELDVLHGSKANILAVNSKPAKLPISEKRTREMVIAAHKLNSSHLRRIDGLENAQASSSLNDVYHSFSFFEASSRLYEDLDYDGFYQTFGVTFDADVDVIGGSSKVTVFAELYLSQDGGPWVHYFTSDDFVIDGKSTLDDYEVLTTLNAGYDMDHYDVLIDLYEVGYSEVVASISANDTDGLYA